MTRLSNSLTDLADKVKEASRLAVLAERTSAEKAIEAGGLLIEAKGGCDHGQWLPFLKRAEIPERKAQRLMQLHRLALNPTTVSDLGGIQAALRWNDGFRLPLAHEVLLVSLDGFEPRSKEPAAYVYQKPGGYHVVMFDLNEVTPHTKYTDKPVTTEQAVRLSVYQLLDHRFSEMSFHVVNQWDHERDFETIFAVPERSRGSA